MRVLRTIVLSALTGALAALVADRLLGRSANAAPPGVAVPEKKKVNSKSRTLEELSPTFKDRRPQLIDYDDEEVAFFIDNLAMELVQPGMTELEAERVGMQLSAVAREALSFDYFRKKREKRHKERANEWLSNIGEISDDEDLEEDNSDAQG